LRLPRPRFTMRRLMFAVAAIAVILWVVVNERWHWGYPRRVPYDESNAISWMATVISSDFRKYDGGDVQALMGHIVGSGRFLGKTREQIVAQLGPPESPESLRTLDLKGQDFFYLGSPPPSLQDRLRTLGLKGQDFFYSVGRVPTGWRAGPPMLVFHFNNQGTCVSTVPYGSW
jgi:hypothetical protein